MLVRKNTKAFKTILQLINTCQDRADRDQLIRLYITKAGDSLADRISIEGIEGDAALFYEMTYQTVLNNLKSSNHQLYASDDIPGIYFFHSSSNKVWDETPFEFDELVRKEFASLPELPVVRKKEAAKKFVLPTRDLKQRTAPARREKSENKEGENKERAKSVKRADKGPTQPDFKLKHPIEFSSLDKLVFRQAKVTKQDILEYYNTVAEYLLPWLKDRPLWTRFQSEGSKLVEMTIEALFKDNPYEMPEWVMTAAGSNNKQGSRLLRCNDREHLLLYVERGCLEFAPVHSRTKDPGSPDYMLIAIDSPDSGLQKAIDVALIAREILTGLKLPSLIKTDGLSGFHISVPLDAKSDYETSQKAAEYICKLITLKIPDLVTLKGSTGYVYGKVTLDYTINQEGKGIIAPFSLVASASPTVATPLLWDEVGKGLRVEDFNHKSMIQRLQKGADPFAAISGKKIRAADLLTRLDEHYAFLV